VLPSQAKEASLHFETGHVCRNCESHIVRIPGSDYYWCPTCGADSNHHVSDICMCGAHVGKHDALLRCASKPGWASELNTMIRRKVAVVPRPQPVIPVVKYRDTKHELFEID